MRVLWQRILPLGRFSSHVTDEQLSLNYGLICVGVKLVVKLLLEGCSFRSWLGILWQERLFSVNESNGLNLLLLRGEALWRFLCMCGFLVYLTKQWANDKM